MVAGTLKTEIVRSSLLSPRHVRRPRLTRLLDEARGQAVVIAAPPGYGKTALAAEWAEDKPDVAWYRASAASADLAAFCVGLATALRPLAADAGERLLQRIRAGEVPEQDVRAMAELLAGDLGGWPDDAWVVIDDYHLVGDAPAV